MTEPYLTCGENAIYMPDVICITFDGLSKITIEQGGTLDLYSGVTATDQYGNEYEFTISPDPNSFSTATTGTYWFTYEAEGQTAVREVEIIAVKRTVLYTDYTLIINELGDDRQDNIALHGDVYREYFPLDSTHPYIDGDDGVPWNNTSYNIYYVEIGSPISPTNTSKWFVNRPLHSCDFTGMDTSLCTNMSQMFANFFGITELEQLDLSMFDTANVTDMESMFYGQSMLEDIDLSSFDTSNVTNMLAMFEGCSALETLDLSGFDTSSVTDFRKMFMACRSLQTLYENFNTDNAISFDSMFTSCESLTSLDLRYWGTSNVVSLESMFAFCTSLVTLNLCGWDSTNFERTRYMFQGCSALTTIRSYSWYGYSQLPWWQTGMWSGCSSLVGGDGTTWDSSNLGLTSYAKVDGGSQDKGYFTLCK